LTGVPVMGTPWVTSERPLRPAVGQSQHLEFEVCSGIAQPVEQAAVNRKVQSSNLCPGANFELHRVAYCFSVRTGLPQTYSNWIATLPQREEVHVST
jgi:hypothetical protein